jgi:hypothetical protein
VLWDLSGIVIDRIKPFILSGIRPEMLYPVFGLEAKANPPPSRPPTPVEQYWLSWFRELTEIHASIDRLEEAEAYIGQYPAKRTFRFRGISEASWIRYHIEMYLQEQYILFNRLQRFLRRVKRTATKAKDTVSARLAADLLGETAKGFSPVMQNRASHVHVERLRDKDLGDLDLFVLLCNRPTDKRRTFIFLRKLQAEFVKVTWSKRFRQNNKAIGEHCKHIYKVIMPILVALEPKHT